MKSVNPEELSAHKAFFTEFDRFSDPRRWSSENEKQAISRLLERKIKLLLITKAHVVIAASQLLESPFAYDFLQKYPELLSSGAVISSMKLRHESSVQFLQVKREEEKDKLHSPYHSSQAHEVAQLIDQIGTSVPS